MTCSFFPRGHSVVIIGEEKMRGFCSLNYVFVAYVEKYKEKSR